MGWGWRGGGASSWWPPFAVSVWSRLAGWMGGALSSVPLPPPEAGLWVPQRRLPPVVEGLREPRETLASWPVTKHGGGEGKDSGGLNGRWARARAGWASASLALWFEWVLSMEGTGRPEPRPGIKRWGGEIAGQAPWSPLKGKLGHPGRQSTGKKTSWEKCCESFPLLASRQV